ncbi:amidase [Comamonas thiooxydans]|uniref:amidase n=1 Tax=Comamonas thiooxydans TaxID=363952 RepID=UPI001CCAA424|nr:amidase [Comamonas thiooxydans]UBQ43924.1 amidase [Comamonas thiooxydans]
MSNTDIHFFELLQVGQQIQSRERSSVEVTRHMLARIEAVDSRIRSYALATADQAMEDAERADTEIATGHTRGPLHGVPLAVKDLFWTAGIPTSHGMSIHSQFRPTEDATVIRRLRDAGAVLLGKLKQTEGAFADHHPSITPPLNPWSPSLWPGASSSGSGVATAAGLCFGSLGTDTGGSIRFPSAANGVTGLKPTWGRVSRHGSFELAASMDHIGPMTRSAADAGAILAAIAGPDPLDPTAAHVPVPNYLSPLTDNLTDLRIGVDTTWTMNSVDAATKSVLAAALQTFSMLGARIHEISFPDAEQAVRDWVPLCAVETAVAHESTFPSRKAEYGPGLTHLIETGAGMAAMDYQKLLLRRAAFSGRVRALFASVDLLLIPTTAFAAQSVERMATFGEDAELFAGMLRYTCPFDLTGNPTITLPGGCTQEGAPVAFQLVARHFAEDMLINTGRAFQQATDWHKRHPAV